MPIDISSIVEKMNMDSYLRQLNYQVFGDANIKDIHVITSIGMYEKSIVPTGARFQRWLRGEVKSLHSYDGWQLFKELKCNSCHNGPAFGNRLLKPKIGESSFEGRFRMTKDSSDYGIVKVPQLYNLKDASTLFHSSDPISVYKAIKSAPKAKAYPMGASRTINA